VYTIQHTGNYLVYTIQHTGNYLVYTIQHGRVKIKWPGWLEKNTNLVENVKEIN
jgi:hypothetical protein